MEIDDPRVVHFHAAVGTVEGLRRVGRRGLPLRDLHLGIETFQIEFDVLGNIVGHLAKQLVGVLLFHEVVELRELETAN